MKTIEDYYSKPMLNWLFKWEAIDHRNHDIYSEGQYPIKRISKVLWRNKFGWVWCKKYNYQVFADENNHENPHN